MWHGQFHTADGLKSMFANVANFLLKSPKIQNLFITFIDKKQSCKKGQPVGGETCNPNQG